jgi:hypothetical protein
MGVPPSSRVLGFRVRATSDDDLALFYSAYVGDDPTADMNGDDFVEGNDEDDYIEAFCEGCPVPS